MYFNKPKAKYNFLNDLDSDVFNLFMVVKNDRENLHKAIFNLPIHQDLMKYWKKNNEDDNIWRAVRFLFISNFTYLSKGYNLKFSADNTREVLLSRIEPTFEMLRDAKLMNVDFRKVLKTISFADESGLCKRSDSFIYSDPPYYETEGWYTENSNKEQDVKDHFDLLCDSNIRFAMSEFDNEMILDFASDRKLNVIPICERRNLKNRRNEILITNFTNNQLQLFAV